MSKLVSTDLFLFCQVPLMDDKKIRKIFIIILNIISAHLEISNLRTSDTKSIFL